MMLNNGLPVEALKPEAYYIDTETLIIKDEYIKRHEIRGMQEIIT